MKAVIYISSLSRGGAERVVTTLAAQLKKECEITVLTDTVNASEYEESDFERINLNYVVYPDVVRRILHKFLYLKKLKRQVKRLSPDVVISFSIESGMRMKQALGKSSVKQIISVRSNPTVDYTTAKEKESIIKKLSDTDGFVFQTKDQRDFFGKEIAERSTIILNPIAPEFMEEHLRDKIEKRVVTAGRLTKSKDHPMLLRAYDLAAEELPDYEFVIYGDGQLRSKMEKLHATLQHKDRIILYGECENVREKIKNAAVFVMSSKNEGLPNALMEAMALGLPVVSTDCPCGGPALLIENDKNGKLTPVGDEKAMAKAITELCKNRQKAEELGKEAGKIKERCNDKRIAKQWMGYLEQVVNR